jgi:hypothetical protein
MATEDDSGGERITTSIALCALVGFVDDKKNWVVD